jgi:hypothetical protein
MLGAVPNAVVERDLVRRAFPLLPLPHRPDSGLDVGVTFVCTDSGVEPSSPTPI